MSARVDAVMSFGSVPKQMLFKSSPSGWRTVEKQPTSEGTFLQKKDQTGRLKMPTHGERKNPSTGTKVDQGQDAPVHREAAGIAATESLAAESIRHGGEFAQNRHAQPKEISGGDIKSQSLHEGDEGGYAGEAPGYVVDLTDTKGPHGKNIKEGIADEAGVRYDGLERALRSEPGSEDDPSRLAEAQMLQRQSLGARGAGPRQSHLEGGTIYDALDREASS
ncbi:hypothetical protein V8C42DRAFT_141441 [Trichoderma barbatum]